MSMSKRKITPDGTTVPVLGLGGMRMPDVEQDTATAIIGRAVELGVKYLETSPGYGDSEIKIGTAVSELGIRDKVLISTKSSSRDAAGMQKNFEDSLERLRVDYFDFYHMWFVNDMDNFKRLSAPGAALDKAEELRDKGLIKHIGITTHAKNEEIKQFIDTGRFELVTLYYNAYDVGIEDVVDYAHEKGLGVVCMGPLRGGFLSSDNSDKLGFMRDEHAETNATGALRWLSADSRVSVIIPGCTSVEQLEEDYRALSAPPMTAEKRADVVKKMKVFEKLKEGICSTCDYCKEHCPQEIPISSILTYLAQYEIYGTFEFAKRRYSKLKIKADECIECEACMEHCPQKLDIPRLLKRACEAFGD